MVKCMNCGRKVSGHYLVCCHCGYPVAVARVIPWPPRLWSAAPQKFWNTTMLVSLFFALLSAFGILVPGHFGLTYLDCAFLLLSALSFFVLAYVGSRRELR